MKTSIFIEICLLICLIVTCSANAETLTGNNFQEIVKIANTFGEAKLVMPPENDPYFEGKIGNILYNGFFTDCNSNVNCKSLILRMIYVNHGKSINEVNTFNANTKIGKLYIEDNNNLIFDFFINLEHGILSDNLRSCFEWFFVGIQDVVKNIQKDTSSESKDLNSIKDRLRDKIFHK